MPENRENLLPAFRELAEELRGLLSGLTETPGTRTPDTGDRFVVEKKLLNLDLPDREKYRIERKQTMWRLWNHKLGTLGRDYIGTVVLSWECDLCNVYNVKARHDTQLMDLNNIMIDLDIDCTPKSSLNQKKTGEYPLCGPVSMDVVLHLTLYRRFSKNTAEIQVFPTIAQSFTIEVELLPWGKIIDHTHYDYHVHENDWDEENTMVKSEDWWGLKRL